MWANAIPPDERAAFFSPQVFSNHLIVENIVKTSKYSINDLKAFRLVNKSFSDASLPPFRQQAAMCLNSTFWWRIDVPEFLEHLENSEALALPNTPFQNFKLEYYTFPAADSIKQFGWIQASVDFQFWMECGVNIKHLHLYDCNFNQANLANVISNWVPNLETLIIGGIRKEPVTREKESKLWKVHKNLKVLHVSVKLPCTNWRFLKNFPNLTEIKLSRFADKNLFPDLRALRSESKPKDAILNLRTIDVWDTQQCLKGLAEARLPLQNLALWLERDTKEAQVRDIMNSQSKTLQYLFLGRHPFPNWPNWSPLPATVVQFNFPAMQELYLCGGVVSSFDFLKWMPSLRKLTINLMCFYNNLVKYDCSPFGEDKIVATYFNEMVLRNSQLLLNDKNFAHKSLQHFEMDFNAFTFKNVMMLSKWMPNLKSFAGVLTSKPTFSLVCARWKKLEHFQLLQGSVICDEGITGISFTSKNYKQSRQPNLTDLRDLRSFRHEWYDDSGLLTGVSAYFAFLKMPKLERLIIRVHPELSAQTETTLKRAIPHVEIIRYYQNHKSHYDLRCCQ